MSTTWAGVIFVCSLIAALALVHKPLGDYMARVLTSKRHLALEKVVYRAAGVDADADQAWGRCLSTWGLCCSGTDSCVFSNTSGRRKTFRR
jgi:K+-transporting ATPase ATPase A chain